MISQENPKFENPIIFRVNPDRDRWSDSGLESESTFPSWPSRCFALAFRRADGGGQRNRSETHAILSVSLSLFYTFVVIIIRETDKYSDGIFVILASETLSPLSLSTVPILPHSLRWSIDHLSNPRLFSFYSIFLDLGFSWMLQIHRLWIDWGVNLRFFFVCGR